MRRTWASPDPSGKNGSQTLALPLHWEWRGDKGDPLLLIHGFSTNGATWRPWIPSLSRSHRVLVVDLKGAGSAPKPRGGRYGPREQAALLHRLILREDLKRLTLVGHSMGGGIALLTALKLLEESPGRLRAMALLAPAAYRQPLPFFIRTAARPWLGPLALRMLPASFIIRAGLRRAYHDPTGITRAQVEAYAHPLRSRRGRYALSRMARQLIPPDLDSLEARYREITLPSLLIWGAYDRVVPVRMGERLAGELPRASLKVLPDCGHMPQEEDPEESLRIFREFLHNLSDATRPWS